MESSIITKDIEVFTIESSNHLKNLTAESLFTKIKITKRNCGKSSMSWPLSKRKKKVIPSEPISDDKIVQDPQSMCEIMNNFFVYVGKNLADKIQPVTN